MQKRGQLTESVQSRAVQLLGREITLAELRLMPYLQYCMMNDRRFDPAKMNKKDRVVQQLWIQEGHIEGGASGLGITKEFWDTINDILFIAYVDIDE